MATDGNTRHIHAIRLRKVPKYPSQGQGEGHPLTPRRLSTLIALRNGLWRSSCCAWKETLLAAAADFRPNLITNYLWDLAKAYSGFFQNCP